MKRTIVRGETLSGLAQKYGMDVDDLMKANPHITDKNKIYAGASISIPILRMRLDRLIKRLFGR